MEVMKKGINSQEAKRGDRVSLNVPKRSFYFQDGEHGIYLAAGKTEVAIISDKITDYQLSQINHDIKNEHLILGWVEKKAEIANKDSEIQEVLLLGRNKINDWMHAIRDDKKLRMETKVHQIESIIKFEKSGKNRSSVITTAEGILDYMGGVSTVEDTETEKVEIKLTSGNSEEVK